MKGLSDQQLTKMLNELRVLAAYRQMIELSKHGILFLSPFGTGWTKKAVGQVIYNHESLVWACEQNNSLSIAYDQRALNEPEDDEDEDRDHMYHACYMHGVLRIVPNEWFPRPSDHAGVYNVTDEEAQIIAIHFGNERLNRNAPEKSRKEFAAWIKILGVTQEAWESDWERFLEAHPILEQAESEVA